LSEEVFIKFLKAAPKMGSNYLSLILKPDDGEDWGKTGGETIPDY